MLKVILPWLALLLALASPDAWACGVPARTVVSFPRFDGLSAGVVVQNFTVQLASSDQGQGEAFLQFADRSPSPGQSIGSGGPGPFSIFALGSGGGDLVTGPVPSGLPNPIATGDAWASVATNGIRGAIASFQLRLAANRVLAGVYRDDLDIRVACRRADGSFDISEYPGAFVVQVAVDDAVQLGATQSHIDLGELRATGGASEGRVSIPLRATGSFDVTVRSKNGVSVGQPGGLMQLEGAGGDQIAYDIQANTIAVTNQSTLACSAATSSIDLLARTAPAPGANRLAGIYRDTIEVEITPRFGGPAPTSGCLVQR